MLPDPLHPAIVHFPIALALLVPLFALGSAVAISRGWLEARTWIFVVILQALMLGAGSLSMETGEDQEERVERVVDKQHIHAHEEAAERFVWLAAAALLVVSAGLARGRTGQVGRWASVAMSTVVFAAAAATGKSGGELVYKHGAAEAYVASDGGPARATPKDEH